MPPLMQDRQRGIRRSFSSLGHKLETRWWIKLGHHANRAGALVMVIQSLVDPKHDAGRREGAEKEQRW